VFREVNVHLYSHKHTQINGFVSSFTYKNKKKMFTITSRLKVSESNTKNVHDMVLFYSYLCVIIPSAHVHMSSLHSLYIAPSALPGW